MSISGIASSNAYDPSTLAAGIATKVVKQLDSDQDGSVTKSEYVSGLTSQGISTEEAGKQFDSLDEKQAGAIGQSEIESAIKVTLSQEGIAASQTEAAAPADTGAPPAGGGGGGGGSASATTSSSSDETYDPADANEDGTVSELEQLLYSLTHAETESSSTPTSSESLGNTVDVQA